MRNALRRTLCRGRCCGPSSSAAGGREARALAPPRCQRGVAVHEDGIDVRLHLRREMQKRKAMHLPRYGTETNAKQMQADVVEMHSRNNTCRERCKTQNKEHLHLPPQMQSLLTSIQQSKGDAKRKRQNAQSPGLNEISHKAGSHNWAQHSAVSSQQ